MIHAMYEQEASCQLVCIGATQLAPSFPLEYFKLTELRHVKIFSVKVSNVCFHEELG